MTCSKPLFANICQYISSVLTIFVLHFFIVSPVSAQSSVSIDLVLQPHLTKAQVLSLSNLGISKTGSGTQLFNLVLRNETSQTQDNLYLEVELSSNKAGGRLVHIYQESGFPFSLSPNQNIVANNNQMQDGMPGIDEEVQFDGELTSQGREFINNLEGSTSLPSDIYTITLSVYQDGNSMSGGRLLDSIQESFGGNIATETNIDLYLLMPGGEVGSDESITTTLPVFRWEGPTNTSYRLVIVEDNGQSPETLVQSALGTEPILNDGSSAPGSLLDYEIIDARVSNSTFTMPPSGVQSLEAGQTYYWQVFTIQESVNNTQTTPSEIWEFSVASDEGTTMANDVNREAQNTLNQILGEERYNQLTEQGMQFNAITIEGQTYRGAAAVQKLRELSNQIQNGEIEIVNN